MKNKIKKVLLIVALFFVLLVSAITSLVVGRGRALEREGLNGRKRMENSEAAFPVKATTSRVPAKETAIIKGVTTETLPTVVPRAKVDHRQTITPLLIVRTPSREAVLKQFPRNSAGRHIPIIDTSVGQKTLLVVYEAWEGGYAWLHRDSASTELTARVGLAALTCGDTKTARRYLRGFVNRESPVPPAEQEMHYQAAGILAWLEDDPTESQRLLQISLNRHSLDNLCRAISFCDATGSAQLKEQLIKRLRAESPKRAARLGY